jgi:hypothetical protein
MAPGRAYWDTRNEAVDNLGKVGAVAVLAIVYQRYSDDVGSARNSLVTPAASSGSCHGLRSSDRSTARPSSDNSAESGSLSLSLSQGRFPLAYRLSHAR